MDAIPYINCIKIHSPYTKSDPDVVYDIMLVLDNGYPDYAEFQHSEGNSAAHLKASAVSSSVIIIAENCKPVLGMWQGIYFCEFDPPRKRKFYVKVL